MVRVTVRCITDTDIYCVHVRPSVNTYCTFLYKEVGRLRRKSRQGLAGAHARTLVCAWVGGRVGVKLCVRVRTCMCVCVSVCVCLSVCLPLSPK